MISILTANIRAQYVSGTAVDAILTTLKQTTRRAGGYDVFHFLLKLAPLARTSVESRCSAETANVNAYSVERRG